MSNVPSSPVMYRACSQIDDLSLSISTFLERTRACLRKAAVRAVRPNRTSLCCCCNGQLSVDRHTALLSPVITFYNLTPRRISLSRFLLRQHPLGLVFAAINQQQTNKPRLSSLRPSIRGTVTLRKKEDRERESFSGFFLARRGFPAKFFVEAPAGLSSAGCVRIL